MMRMVIANHVVPSASTSIVDGQEIRQTLYEITDLGVSDWTAAHKFYQNLSPPPPDLLPVVTSRGQLVPYDEEIRDRVSKATLGNALMQYVRAALANR